MNPVEQINNIKTLDDFLNFAVSLAVNAKEHPEEWANITVADYIGQIASWMDDMGGFEDDIDWDKIDYKTFAKLLYMGKIYE